MKIFSIFCRLFTCAVLICALVCKPCTAHNITSNAKLSSLLDDKPRQIDLSVVDIEVSELLRLLAEHLRTNIMISPSVNMRTSINVKHIACDKLLQSILVQNHLSKMQVGDIFLIAPHDELIKYQQAQQHLTEQLQETDVLVTKLWRLKYANASHIASVFMDGANSLLSKRGVLRMDKRTNTIIVKDNRMVLKRLHGLLQILDANVPKVLIKVKIVAVDTDFEHLLGISYSIKSRAATPEAENGSVLSFATLAHATQIDVKLAALENSGHAEIISSPSLFTDNQKAASIEAGEEVPYQEVSESGGTATVFKKAVLSLKVIPQVLPQNNVLLQLKINQDRPSGHLVLGVPTISTRQLSTQVLVKQGETVILGGIYETDSNHGFGGIPILNRIPLLGWLFSQRSVRLTKRQLLIFVTPMIVKSA